MRNRIFVFGSNLAGIHGAGSARHAYNHHGAVWGKGHGRMGDSYAIPTKGFTTHSPVNRFTILGLTSIRAHIFQFLAYAEEHPELDFDVVEIGCGLAGYTPQEIAPCFKTATNNVFLSNKFNEILGRRNRE